MSREGLSLSRHLAGNFFSAVADGAKGSILKGRRCIFVARAVPFRSWREGGTTTTRFLLGAQLHPYLWKKEEREKYIALSPSAEAHHSTRFKASAPPFVRRSGSYASVGDCHVRTKLAAKEKRHYGLCVSSSPSASSPTNELRCLSQKSEEIRTCLAFLPVSSSSSSIHTSSGRVRA